MSWHYEAILEVKFDRRNFYNKMLKLGILTEAVPRPQMPLVAHQRSIVSMQTSMQNLNKRDLDWNFKSSKIWN